MALPSTMTIATDRVEPTPKPQRWQVRRLMGAAIAGQRCGMQQGVLVHIHSRGRAPMVRGERHDEKAALPRRGEDGKIQRVLRGVSEPNRAPRS
jgi:hypothetical protein